MKRKLPILAVAGLILAATTVVAETETYKFDKAHTLVGFRIRHLLTKVEGRFKDFDGTIWLDRANPSASKVELTIQTASIDTGVDARDKDLRSPNYFDADKYPTITFKSTKVEPKGNDLYDVTGEFTMHGVTKTIKVPVKSFGFAKMGKTDKAGFEVALTLSRKDYGIEKGAPVVGDDVELNIQVEANKEIPAEAKPAAPAKN
ncbi:MAG TPA: YceI family protein [Thermoanaerobaculia bacterium]|nr:YceI family protein [Thermoanaerobaculia bacterium]